MDFQHICDESPSFEMSYAEEVRSEGSSYRLSPQRRAEIPEVISARFAVSSALIRIVLIRVLQR